LATFSSAEDYVYDVQWSPTHPAVFATADGTGIVSLWNINQSIEVFFFFKKIFSFDLRLDFFCCCFVFSILGTNCNSNSLKHSSL